MTKSGKPDLVGNERMWPFPSCALAQLVIRALRMAMLASSAFADNSYYKGKRVTVLINFTAGGPTDIEGRLFAKHLADHIESRPQVIVQNMDGAGGMIGAGYLGEVAPKDGTMVGYFTGTAWRYANDPERFRTDFRTYDFLAYQPGSTSIMPAATWLPGSRTRPTSSRRRAWWRVGSAPRTPRIC